MASSSHITLTAADGFQVAAYVGEPAGTPKGAIVVLQEIFGVNSHIRGVADGYAAAGYLAIVRARQGRTDQNVWRLKPLMNTGPLSPTILHMEAVFDRNLRKVMGDEQLAREVAS